MLAEVLCGIRIDFNTARVDDRREQPHHPILVVEVNHRGMMRIADAAVIRHRSAGFIGLRRQRTQILVGDVDSDRALRAEERRSGTVIQRSKNAAIPEFRSIEELRLHGVDLRIGRIGIAREVLAELIVREVRRVIAEIQDLARAERRNGVLQPDIQIVGGDRQSGNEPWIEDCADRPGIRPFVLQILVAGDDLMETGRP